MKKPFDLEAALAGKPVVTREGHQVDRVVSFVGVSTSTEFSVMFCAKRTIYSCKADGKMYTGHSDGPRDLFMEVEEEIIWVNVYRNSFGQKYTGSFPTEEAADAACQVNCHTRINGKAYKVVLDEGTE